MISWYIDSSCCIASSREFRAPGVRGVPGGGVPPGITQLTLNGGRLLPGAEEALSVTDAVGQRVDLGVAVVYVERRPGAGLHAKGPVQRPGAVVAGAHRDTQFVEHLAHVVRVDAFHIERYRAA